MSQSFLGGGGWLAVEHTARCYRRVVVVMASQYSEQEAYSPLAITTARPCPQKMPPLPATHHGHVFAAKAVELLAEGHTGVMVGFSNGKFESYPLDQVVACGTSLLDKNSDYVLAARDLGIYVGEL